MRQKSIVDFVFALLSRSGPSTILRRVRTIVVDSIKSVGWRWTQTNIRKEVLEGLPPFAYDNSASTISRKTMVRRIFASLTHHLPNSEFWRVCFSMRRDSLSMHTTAGLGSANAKRISKCRDLVATITKAQPAWIWAWVSYSGLNKQTAKALPCEVNKWWHESLYSTTLAAMQGGCHASD